MEFDLRNHIGEKHLNNNVMNTIKREIDLIIFLLKNIIEFSENKIDTDEFFKVIDNIKTHSSLKNTKLYSINKFDTFTHKNHLKFFINMYLDFDLLMRFFNEFKLNQKDKDIIKTYYNKKLEKFRDLMDSNLLIENKRFNSDYLIRNLGFVIDDFESFDYDDKDEIIGLKKLINRIKSDFDNEDIDIEILYDIIDEEEFQPYKEDLKYYLMGI